MTKLGVKGFGLAVHKCADSETTRISARLALLFVWLAYLYGNDGV